MEINKVCFWCKKLLILSCIIGVVFIFKYLNPLYDFTIFYYKIPQDQLSKWEFIKSLAYLFGLTALVFQIIISNRRADAAEKTAKAQLQTAKAQLQSNRETRYNNAMKNLLQDKPLASIGAIYNLYHISQTSD